jgi:hypothetical protein
MAGKIADVPTLQAARALGLQLTGAVLIGAAEAASMPIAKLQWLHTEQGCALPDNISYYAAVSGTIDTLRWLKEHGVAFTVETCKGAAAGAHLHVLQYLRAEGCERGISVCTAAAKMGHLSTLKWLHEQGCPWNVERICGDAAESGSIERRYSGRCSMGRASSCLPVLDSRALPF